MQDGLNRYTYVHANPETYNDPNGHCTRYAYSSAHWWGVSIYINGCLVNDLNAVIGIGGAFAAFLAGWCGLDLVECGWWASWVLGAIVAGWEVALTLALIVLVFALYAIWVNWANGYCDNRGVFLDHGWWGSNWVGTVC